MNNFINFYTKMSYIKSMMVRFIIIAAVLTVAASVTFSQDSPTPTPVPSHTPTEITTPTPDPTLPEIIDEDSDSDETTDQDKTDNPRVTMIEDADRKDKVEPVPSPTVLPEQGDDTRTKGKSDAETSEDSLELPPEPPLVAPNYEAPKRTLPSPERVGIDLAQQTPISLEDAIRMALESNNDIELTQTDVKTAELDLTIADGTYIPQIKSETFFQRSTTPTASTLGGGQDGTLTQTSFRGNIGLSAEIPYQGGRFTTDFSTNRTTTNDTFTSLNPQFQSTFKFEYTQPLLRGRKFDNSRRQIEIARKNLTLTDSQFRLKVIDIVSRIETAYWDLTYALRNLQVQLDGVKEAQKQVESLKRQVEQGTIAPIDVVAGRSQVSNFEQNVYTAQENVTRAENTLKNLILPDRKSEMWNTPLVPVTPIDVEPPKIGLQDSLDTALSNRPEISQLEISKDINDIDKTFFKDQTKPQVDLVGSYTSQGLAGTPVTGGANPLTSSFGPIIERVNILSDLNNLPPIPFETTGGGTSIPGNLNGGYFKSLTNVLTQKYPTFQIGVRISIPWKNNVAEANYGKTLVQETRIKTQRDITEQSIEADVRNALQSVRSAEARLKAAADSRNSAELLYESEQRKYKAGTSTVFLVLERQTALIESRGRELQAQTNLNKAIGQFQRAIGTSLNSAGVTFNDQNPQMKKPGRTQITTVLGNPVYKSGEASSLIENN